MNSFERDKTQWIRFGMDSKRGEWVPRIISRFPVWKTIS